MEPPRRVGPYWPRRLRSSTDTLGASKTIEKRVLLRPLPCPTRVPWSAPNLRAARRPPLLEGVEGGILALPPRTQAGQHSTKGTRHTPVHGAQCERKGRLLGAQDVRSCPHMRCSPLRVAHERIERSAPSVHTSRRTNMREKVQAALVRHLLYWPVHWPYPFFSIRSAHASYSTKSFAHAMVFLHFSSYFSLGSATSSSSDIGKGVGRCHAEVTNPGGVAIPVVALLAAEC